MVANDAKSPNWPLTWSPKMMPTWLYRQDFSKFSLNRHYNAHASKPPLEKLDSVQARATKVIVGAVSSVNKVKVVKECSLDSFEKRRIYNLIKLTNKVRSLKAAHIARIIFENYNSSTKLKRSSPMQFDSEIIIPLSFEHNKCSIYQKSLFCAGLSKNTPIVTCPLEPCTKSEPTNIIKAKGLKIIDKYQQNGFVFANTEMVLLMKHS
ncbi:RNase H domain-containing protein [Trichonephila clavipes]|nr:RNase H domain-containing protein [Trichonephila clavipes]